MNQMMLFDIPTTNNIGEVMNKMTWLDLYTFLNKKANSVNSFNETSKFWSQHVMVHNVETGDEYPCDTMVFSHNNRLVLAINDE